MDDVVGRITEILRRGDPSDPGRTDELLELVYEDLRALATRYMRREHGPRTLQPTALVHEAYMRLAGTRPPDWEGRSHFFRVAGRAMRQVLVDEARRRGAVKRGGDARRVTLDTQLLDDSSHERDFLDLHDSLERLGRMDPHLENLVELRVFSGLTLDETASTLGVSRRKVAKDWAAARLWLHRDLAGS